MVLQAEQVVAAFDPRHLNLILLPTERCNFRCTYCYESFLIGRMQRSVIDGVKALIDRRMTDLNSLEISWFGGEPLLARDIVEEISHHALGGAVRSGVSYSANMTTNGSFLSPETAAVLADLGVRTYQVSLDGPEATHDRTRVMAGGGPTFSRIWGNLVGIRDTSLRITVILRVHYSPTNLSELDPLIAAINETFGHDTRFRILFKAIERLGGPNDDRLPVFGHADEEAIRQRLEAKLVSAEQIYSLAPDGGAYVCYASQANSLVVRATGALGKCTVALYDDANLIGRLRPDGTVAIDQDKFRAWLHGFETMDEDELACPLMTTFARHRAGSPPQTVPLALDPNTEHLMRGASHPGTAQG